MQMEKLFEISDTQLSRHKLGGQKDAYFISDDLEYPVGGKIPLWTLGFFY